MLILALEASTTSAKAALFDSASGTISVRGRRFEVAGRDSAIRDGDAVVAQLMTLGREVAAGAPVDLIALAGTWHGLTLRSPTLEAVTPVFEWPYTGAQDVCVRLREDRLLTRWFYERTGCMVNATYPAFKLMHLAEQGVDLTGCIVMDQPSVTFARLTGEVWSTGSLASGTGLFNTHDAVWDEEVRRRFGLEKVVLPELHDATDTAPLTSHASALLGLRRGIPVLAPEPDGGLNQVGNLATAPGEMTFSMGTSGALRVATARPCLSPTLSTWAYHSPTGPLSGAATAGCTNCVEWAREHFFGRSTDYAKIETALSADRRGLPVFMPFLFGERCPGWQDQRRGGLVDLDPQHTPSDLYQAVLEGIVYSLYHCYRELTALNGTPRRIVLSGGVLSSPFWSQLTVDVFGATMEVSTQPHGSVIGALRMGLRAAGVDERHPALDELEPHTIEPRAERRHQYDEGYVRYLDHYERTAPRFEGAQA